MSSLWNPVAITYSHYCTCLLPSFFYSLTLEIIFVSSALNYMNKNFEIKVGRPNCNLRINRKYTVMWIYFSITVKARLTLKSIRVLGKFTLPAEQMDSVAWPFAQVLPCLDKLIMYQTGFSSLMHLQAVNESETEQIVQIQLSKFKFI